ncbi:T9SS type A sorting domain-containing protein [bacterium]|nr:T9SS type A sorting domain-containing protein [bacterium]
MKIILFIVCTILSARCTYAQPLEYQSKWIIDINGKVSLADNNSKSKQVTCTTPDKGVVGFAGFKNYANIGNKKIYHEGDFKLLFKIDSLGKLAWHKVLIDSINSAIGTGSFLRVDKSGNIYFMMSAKATSSDDNWPDNAGGLICLSSNGTYKWSKEGFTGANVESNYFENPMYSHSQFNGVFAYQLVEFQVLARYGVIAPNGQFKPLNNDYKNLPSNNAYFHPYNHDVYFLCNIWQPTNDWQVDSQLTIPADSIQEYHYFLLRMDSTGTMHYLASFFNQSYISNTVRFCATDKNRLIIGFTYRANDTLWYDGKKLGASKYANNPSQLCLDRNGKLVWFSECDYNYYGGSSTFVFEENIRNGKLISLYSFYDDNTGMFWDSLEQQGGGQFIVTLDTATGKAKRLMKTFFYGRLGMLTDTKYAELILLEEPIELDGKSYNPVDSINRFFIAMADTFTKPNSIEEKFNLSASIYPNPSKQSFNLSLDQDKPLEASIYNANGILIKKLAITNGANFGIDWPSGVYFVKITDKNGQSTFNKIIKI